MEEPVLGDGSGEVAGRKSWSRLGKGGKGSDKWENAKIEEIIDL